MTTTTLTAPLTLLWTQAKILKTLLMVLVVGSVSLWIGPVLPVALPLAGIVYATLVVFSGPIIFGSEYSEGQADFLATRPVSARLVFTVKTTAVVMFWLIASAMWFVSPPLEEIPLIPGILLFAPVLSATLWCSLMSVMTRDTVRGILYGAVSFIPIGWLWYEVPKRLFRPELIIRSGEMPEAFFSSYGVGPLLSWIGAILSPVVFLGILSIGHRYRTIGVWRPTWCGSLGVGTIIAYIIFCQGILSTDGTTEVLAGNHHSQVVATKQAGDQLYWAETKRNQWFHPLESEAERESAKAAPSLRIRSLDLGNEESIPKLHASIPSFSKWGFREIDSTFFTTDRLFLFGGCQMESRLYRWGPDSPPHLLAEFEPTVFQPGMFPVLSDEDRLVFHYSKIPDGTREVQSIEIDLRDGSLHEIEPLLGDMEQDELTALKSLGIRIENFQSQDPIEVIDEETGDSVRLPKLNYYALEGRYLAGLPGDPGHPYLNITIDSSSGFELMHIYDLKDPGNPIAIPLPDQVRKYNRLIEGYASITQSKVGTPAPALAFGGGYLTLWFRGPEMVAAWDVSDPMSPVFVGTVPFSYFLTFPEVTEGRQSQLNRFHIEPTVREDGALGYLTHSGSFLWLEFPALMKEARKS